MQTASLGRFLVPALLCAATFAGCGDAADESVPVSGTVTFDGAPLPSGSITLLPSDGVGSSAGAEITDGKYETKALPGPKQVTITANREKAGGNAKADPHAGPPTEQYLPAKYNSATELKADIPADGSDKINFELQSK
jgi:hypothetical protein